MKSVITKISNKIRKALGGITTTEKKKTKGEIYQRRFSVFGNSSSQKVPNKNDKIKMFQHKRMYQKVIRKLSFRSEFHPLNKIIAKQKLYKHHVIMALNELLEHCGICLYIGYDTIISYAHYSVSYNNNVPLVLYTDSNMVIYVYGLDEDDGGYDVCRVLLHIDEKIDMAVVDNSTKSIAEETSKYKGKMGKERNVLMYYSSQFGGNLFYDTYQCVYPITPTRLEEEMKWVVKGIPRCVVADYAMCMEDTQIYNMFMNGRNNTKEEHRNEKLEGEILILDNNIIKLQMEMDELKEQTNTTNESLNVLSHSVKSGEEERENIQKELERWKCKCLYLEEEMKREKQHLKDYKSEHSVILHSLLDENKKWMERYSELKNTFKILEAKQNEEKCLMKLEWKQKMEDWKTTQMTVMPPEITKEKKVIMEEKQRNEIHPHEDIEQSEQSEEEKNIILWNYLCYEVYYWMVVVSMLVMVYTVNTFVK